MFALVVFVLCTLSMSSADSFRGTRSYQFATTADIPKIFYGTAWKKERTADLVFQALSNGFRGIDTACQPKHYSESGVGDGLQRAIGAGIVSRGEVFLQTKFTPLPGQDPQRVPYNAMGLVADQVRQSFSVSLTNLHTDYVDSLVLHSPMDTLEHTMQVWAVFEELHASGRAKYFGISNIYSLDLLSQVYERATVKPTFIQNRFYRDSHYDFGIREFCLKHGMKYQSFWTLTASPTFLRRYSVLFDI